MQDVETSQGPSEKRPRANINDNRSSHRVEIWLQGGTYPQEYFESSNTTWAGIKANTVARGFENYNMDGLIRPLLAKKKSAASLHRQALERRTLTPAEKTEDKSLSYRNAGYERELAMRGSYLDEAEEGILEDSKILCQTLLTTTHTVPENTLFSDNLFNKTCRKLRNRNEARIVEDISPLIAPSAETLATYGADKLSHLIFNTNERWGESIPITDTRPQPDRCVGFSESAFTDNQLRKLKPYIGSLVPVNYLSFFLATWRMYFPFFACEAKYGIGDIDVADKQNAHSMSMAVRGIVKLFELAKCEEKLDRKIIAFSISHDGTCVRIYGHYALFKDGAAKFYRHPIKNFDFTSEEGKDKWTAYRFTKSIYFEFMPELHKLICSAIDKIPSDTASQGSSLPPHFSHSDSCGSTDLQSEQPDPQEMAESAPSPQSTERSKKPRLEPTTMLQNEIDWLRQQLAREREDSKERHAELLEENKEMKEQIRKLTDVLTQSK